MHNATKENIVTKRVQDAHMGALLIEVIITRTELQPDLVGAVEYSRLREMTARAISDPNYAIFVTLVNGEPSMFFAGFMGQEFFNYDTFGSLELIIAPASSNYKHLVRSIMKDGFNAFTCWAFAHGAKQVRIGHDSMVRHADVIGKLLGHWGYTRVGEIYSMRAA